MRHGPGRGAVGASLSVPLSSVSVGSLSASAEEEKNLQILLPATLHSETRRGLQDDHVCCCALRGGPLLSIRLLLPARDTP